MNDRNMRSSYIVTVTVGLLVEASAVTLEEVQKHYSSQDCWSAIYGIVYDFTVYGPSHGQGGGPDRVWSVCGTDGTIPFDAVHGDSKEYLEVSSIVVIGDLTEESLPPVDPPTEEPEDEPEDTDGTEEITSAPDPTVDSTEPPLTPQPSVQTPEQATSQPAENPTPVETPAPSSFGVKLKDLAMHDTADDCWVLFYDTVYDMTEYAYQHPGPGETVIHAYCGDNGTAAYAGVHQKGLLSIVEGAIIGPLESTINATQPPVNSPSISFQDLMTHASLGDCWVAFYTVVYDMTNYAYNHPGPAEAAIHPWCGKDGTNAFETFHDKSLLALVENEYVGNLVTSSASRVKCIHAVAVSGVLTMRFFV